MPSPRCLIVVNFSSLKGQSWHEVGPDYIWNVQRIEHSRECSLLHKQDYEKFTRFWDKKFTKQLDFWRLLEKLVQRSGTRCQCHHWDNEHVKIHVDHSFGVNCGLVLRVWIVFLVNWSHVDQVYDHQVDAKNKKWWHWLMQVRTKPSEVISPIKG